MVTVLFVCKSNVGRSQMAEALFKKFSKKHKAASSGVAVDKEGQTLEDHRATFVIKVMKEEGIDVRTCTRRQLTKESVEGADKIIVITDKEDCPDYLRNSRKAVFWPIGDASGTDYDFHLKTLEQIKEKVKALVNELENGENKS